MAKFDHPTNADVALCAGEFWANDPHAALTWMRANAPVYWDEGAGVWGIARYEDIKAVSKDPATFSSAQGIRPEIGPLPMMIDMDDPDHWNRRKLVNRGFTPKRVRDQEAQIREVCNGIIDRVCERGECDFVWDIAAPLPLIMIGDALGVAPEDRDTLMTWSDDMLRSLTGTGDDSEEVAVRAAEAFDGYVEYVTRAAEARRTEPTDDLMSVLVHAEVDGHHLDTDAIVQESLLILIGGDETTRHVVTGGMYQLLANPEQWQLLLADPSALATGIEEMLRWVSPIKNMARCVTTETELRGQVLEPGEKLLLLYPSANRDDDVFPDPFRFDVARTPNEHVAFGFGPHFCLGNSLARLELQVMFEQLLTRLPDLRLADEVGAEADLRPRAANFISGYERMPVVFTPSRPAR